ncbi:MAG: cbb3-type cytochrome oxidase assembly protein CcoS [Crocinitomicaceae bacterium]|jgi:cbb3-type cytochrome oxidase maturation protein|nr:cbb3-type cytochrome oxidase assembly protein CcoS [Crocinitomicaceae bacterium]MBK6951885.1 cbb3-type cytochrome oxidase assembly protein CcoS [Crocinitomicaceae bacterium]MBK9590864.1 cbb3-type cytochrome oxidase assembly protein CcoS [Crocinitomicaceae bacterium]
MEIIFLLIALSIGLALFFLFSFLWATKTGQFEDTYGPSVRILFDDEELSAKSMSNQKSEQCN